MKHWRRVEVKRLIKSDCFAAGSLFGSGAANGVLEPGGQQPSLILVLRGNNSTEYVPHS